MPSPFTSRTIDHLRKTIRSWLNHGRPYHWNGGRGSLPADPHRKPDLRSFPPQEHMLDFLPSPGDPLNTHPIRRRALDGAFTPPVATYPRPLVGRGGKSPLPPRGGRGGKQRGSGLSLNHPDATQCPLRSSKVYLSNRPPACRYRAERAFQNRRDGTLELRRRTSFSLFSLCGSPTKRQPQESQSFVAPRGAAQKKLQVH